MTVRFQPKRPFRSIRNARSFSAVQRTVPSGTDAGRLLRASSDGNAFAVLGKVQRALRQGKVPAEQISEFMAEATSGDYDHLLQTAMRWVNVS